MYVIYGKENAEKLQDRYLLLELDTFNIKNHGHITAYAVISADEMNVKDLEKMPKLPEFKKLHESLLDGYKTQQWDFCLQCIDHLKGKFGGTVDSFYEHLSERIQTLKTDELPDDWDGVIQK